MKNFQKKKIPFPIDDSTEIVCNNSYGSLA